ncbi:hypothetical protein [Bacillus licheniformis]|uniref:hypothetical protein n=1 Tax=Bacillus licheniformis TaxID=1402 RepID=UPI0009B7D4FA|nr:hypothetical protein [Bacillus licheniformis]ARC72463.1 hypothetical protein B37_00408 [Bacillus licheniformis]ARW41598.1 hypothetical protein S100141_00273 [Bacillus licheniformis]ARW53074.1 hypothetical protein S100027_01075 [Bacillus licheniformis]AXF87727.1 hypothetical protein BLDA23_05320 [Bacillus licheniformis]
MKNIFKYDKETFLLIDNDIIQPDDQGNYEIPDGWTDIPFDPGLYLPKFYPDEKVWKESATKEYIESLQPPEPDPGPSETEVLQKQVADLYYLIALGGS